jgi:hypothetical protein
MDIHIKRNVYIPGFALLTALVLIELAVGLPGEWIILTLLAGMGFVLLVLSSILRNAPSPQPATWVFVISYALLAMNAIGLHANNSHARFIAIAVGAAGLGMLWRGIRRNRCWAWNWTRRIYTALICSGFVATALVPFIPGKFQRQYVLDFGRILAIPAFLLNLAILFWLVLIVRQALMTPADATESAPATTVTNLNPKQSADTKSVTFGP